MRSNSFSTGFILGLILLLLLSFFTGGCKPEKPAPVAIDRFDTELYYLIKHPDDRSFEQQFARKYGDFLPLYMAGVLQMPSLDGDPPMRALRRFFSDSLMLAIYSDEQNRMKDLPELSSDLADAVVQIKKILPEAKIPRFRIHFSALSQSVITFGDWVSIAGDKYLGKDYSNYQGAYYDYMLTDMQAQYMARDAVHAWLQAHYPISKEGQLIDKMVEYGRLLYAAEQLLPGIGPARLFGYSDAQLEWIISNEAAIWAFMAENDQLYADNPLTETKYLGEVPFNTFFGEDAPEKIGLWIGYRIVKEYVRKQDISLSELMKEPDVRKIVQLSEYNP